MSNLHSDPPTKIKVLSGRVVYEPEPPAKVLKTKSRHVREPPKLTEPSPFSQSTMSTPAIDEMEPLYIGSMRDLEEIFREMTPYFEGKESEQNWSRREKSILKLRRITKGNSPQEFTVAYLAGVKSLLDGILKTVNSLRTTVSANGCHLVQEIAKAAGPGLDNMVEILLQSLIKLCANTKKIAAANGDATVNAVVANVTYNVRLAQHIWGACQDKNVQPRSYATGWLKTIITKHRHHKNVLEHAGSLDLIEKCIKAGLADRDPKVRESMRPTFWAFARLWSERSEGIISSLELKQQKLLLDDPANPRPQKEPEVSIAPPGVKPHAFSKSTTSLPPKPSIRETIAAQKRAKMSGKVLPERPGSAEPSATPMKPAAFSSIARPATAMSTIGSLSSAPVRPMRPARRPEMKRPVTADPPPNKKPARLSPSKSTEMDKSPSSYKKSPQISPVKKADPHLRRAPDVSSDRHHDLLASKMKDISFTDNKGHPLIYKATSSSDISPVGDVLSPGEAEPVNEQRISATPRAIASKKESLVSRLKVYEDPIGRGSESPATSQTASRPSVLEELPINEPPIYQPTLSPNYPLLAEESESPLYHRKWINIETGTRRISDSDKTDNPYLMRRMLESGIVRIKAGTLDAHGFRKLQALIRGQEDIWEDGVKFDELLLPLLENLESPNVDDSKRGFGRGQDLKTQVLMTIRLLQQFQPNYFSAHYSRALCAIILARQHYNSTSHMVCGLEETSETIVAQCDPLPSVDAVLDLLEVEPHDDSDTLFMSLYVLAGLLHRVSSLASSNPDSRDESTILHQNVRLGHVAAKCLSNTNPDVRRGVVEFVLELYDAVRDKARFWSLIDGVGEDHRSLITYYLARREKAYGRTERGPARGGTAFA